MPVAKLTNAQQQGLRIAQAGGLLYYFPNDWYPGGFFHDMIPLEIPYDEADKFGRLQRPSTTGHALLKRDLIQLPEPGPRFSEAHQPSPKPVTLTERGKEVLREYIK